MMTIETKKPPKIVVVVGGDNNTRAREFNLNIILNPGRAEEFYPPIPRWIRERVDFTAGVYEALQMLAKMPGVEHITLRKHGFVIRKAHAFEWDQIQPRILDVLVNIFEVEDPTQVEIIHEARDKEQTLHPDDETDEAGKPAEPV